MGVRTGPAPRRYKGRKPTARAKAGEISNLATRGHWERRDLAPARDAPGERYAGL